jgi:hypothetical protein
MVYMFKVYALVAFGVFGLTGTFILTLIAWEQAKQYAAARQAMDRITKRGAREPFAISRNPSRKHNGDSFHAA